MRYKELQNGRRSIYLDIYMNGNRRYKFLKLYLLPDTTKANRDRNKETLRLANAVKAKRIVEIQNGRFGFDDADKSKARLFPYIEQMIRQREKKDSKGNVHCWQSFFRHLQEFERRDSFLVAEISAQWLKKFQTYLLKGMNLKTQERLSQNTRAAYYARMCAVVRQAIKDGILTNNPLAGAAHMRSEEVKRSYLDIDEVRMVAQCDCGRNNAVRDAFLFSCLTGLRISDIRRLTWAEVDDSEADPKIIFRQKKTGGMEYLYISRQARKLIGERREGAENVFSLPTQPYVNHAIREIMKQCGIEKHITFHSARHTFATMMLTIGTDIYTTSKLLGHRSVATTQIYAKIIDEKKKAAVDAIPEII